MEKDYIKEKQVKKKKALKFVWILVLFGIIFVVTMVKFAISGSVSDMLSFGGLPDSDDAYAVAKDFISPTVRDQNISFGDDHYQYAKKSDSVYVIKSFFTATDSRGENGKTNFIITLKYDGGSKRNQHNWTMVDMNKEAE